MLAITPSFTLKASQDAAGKVSNLNSKMPGSTFAISASKCLVGGKLIKVIGSTCHRCYAIKLENVRPSVRMRWGNNYLKATSLIASNPAKWSDAMAFQINRMALKSGEYFHRWFDSGDLQSVEMLAAIVATCIKTPLVSHWLPTREASIVKAYLKANGSLPANLIIRASATMINDKPLKGHANTSTVHRKDAKPYGHVCPASHQGNSCGDCRACWSHTVANVSYPLH